MCCMKYFDLIHQVEEVNVTAVSIRKRKYYNYIFVGNEWTQQFESWNLFTPFCVAIDEIISSHTYTYVSCTFKCNWLNIEQFRFNPTNFRSFHIKILTQKNFMTPFFVCCGCIFHSGLKKIILSWREVEEIKLVAMQLEKSKYIKKNYIFLIDTITLLEIAWLKNIYI